MVKNYRSKTWNSQECSIQFGHRRNRIVWNRQESICLSCSIPFQILMEVAEFSLIKKIWHTGTIILFIKWDNFVKVKKCSRGLYWGLSRDWCSRFTFHPDFDWQKLSSALTLPVQNFSQSFSSDSLRELMEKAIKLVKKMNYRQPASTIKWLKNEHE